jgi:predicted AlkP superfamily phosphohydrolase/phosphomutase
MSKVLIIDLDGATFDLIKPWAKEGILPNFKRIMQEGGTANLQSTTPPITPCAYTSFLTGKSPGKHGVFDFVHREKNSYNLQSVNTNTKKGTAFWKLLNRYGKKTGFINVPTFFPAETLDGFIVGCGLVSPDVNHENFVYPGHLFEKHNLDRCAYILKPAWETMRHGDLDTHYC